MNNNEMKNRWIALYVENEVGVLAKVSGLFSAKSYNLQSLTVGTTEDETISRMTICVTSDDITFEQIKKQLNRMVEVIKVIDLTDVPLHMKEILYVRVSKLTREEITDIFQTAQVFNIDVVDKNADSVILESKLTEHRNDDLIALLKSQYKHISVVRGGAVAIEAMSTGLPLDYGINKGQYLLADIAPYAVIHFKESANLYILPKRKGREEP
mgnify:CR=1 FL=1